MALDEEVQTAINQLWILVASIFCFMLQAGFGLLEVGSVRAKNAQNIMLKNLVDAAIAAIAYWAIGYAFAYGKGGNPFIGNSYYFLKDADDDYIMWFFQMVFASTTATIVSGAVAERCRFRAYLVYSFFLSGVVYPIASHWIWSPDGFMYGKVIDFAGSGAVHLIGGAAAMAGAYFVGPRTGKFVYHEDTKTWETKEIPGHNAVLSALGTFILWVGFFAFNGASCGAFFCPDAKTTGRIVVVTCLSGSAGCLFLLFFGLWRYGNYDMKLAMNGLLAGMVASCGGCNVYDPWAAIVVGIIGASLYCFQNYLLEHIFHIDDPVGASALHMGAGMAGLLCVGFLAQSKFTDGENHAGVFYGGNGKQLAWQIAGIFIYSSWAIGTSSMIFFGLKYLKILRVSPEIEKIGMDTHHHGGSAYNRDSTLFLGAELRSSNLEHAEPDTNDRDPEQQDFSPKDSTEEPENLRSSSMRRRMSSYSIRNGAA